MKASSYIVAAITVAVLTTAVGPGCTQSADPVTTSATAVEQANESLARGDAKAAIARLEKHLKTNAGDDDARIALARAQLAAGAPQDAVATTQDVLSRNPTSADALLLRGLAQRRLGKGDAARADFGRVVEIAPEYCDAHMFLVVSHLDDRNTSAAAKAMENIPHTCRDESTTGGGPTMYARIARRVQFATNPHVACDPRWWQEHGPWPGEGEDPRLVEARRRLAADDVAGAEKLVDEVLADSPTDADANLLKAQIELRRGRYAEAEQRLEAILRRNEAFGYCEVRYALATARLALKKYEDARTAIDDCPYCAEQPEGTRLLQQADAAAPAQEAKATPTPARTPGRTSRSRR